MKKYFSFLFVTFILFSCTKEDKKQSEFISGELFLDSNNEHINAHGAGFLIHDNTYYWFGQHMVSGKEGNKAMVGVRVYSSTDLYNWKNEGVALKMKEDSSSKLQIGSVLERPKVIFNKKTKKFVMWFHHELKDQGYKAALTGVAVADNVSGPYKYINSFRIHANVLPQNFSKEDYDNAAEIKSRKDKNWKEKVVKGAFFKRDFKGGQMSRDMTLFVDDDETGYHITASEENQTLLISKLSDDYLSLTKEYIRVFPGGRNEAPAIFKRNGKYFMFSSGLTGWKPNPARLSVADSMLGKWTSLGNPVIGTTEEKATTFHSQSTYVIPVIDKKDAFIFVADRWRPKNAIDGRYVFLPVQFKDNVPYLEFKEKWDLSIFDK
ncbi:family 43 glycosylhydrolase [Polaribacter haliotis]|uniref:Family 43 glycosylhydrolase n=1 Tax=Polaribacter haliotis TaxID=1888915 RepID=A0A7L8AG43_9FLAO|nr:glycoside hydrolase family 43 protein [Polaribacter haliotis]QOD60937.1 family 43 glycosylhydrolase [Polaribacter haliotis]